MANPSANELLADALIARGFHGLYQVASGDDADGCGCLLDDLVPCGGDPSFCCAGYQQGVWDPDEIRVGPNPPPPPRDERQTELPLGGHEEESE